jgi:hypothetical protein
MLDLDVWHASRSHIDILLGPKIKSQFLRLIPDGLHEDTPLIKADMLEALLARPRKKHPRRPPPSQPPIPSPPIDEFNLTTLQSPYHDAYHSMANISEFGKQLELTFPGLVKRFVVGKSAEGQDVEGLRLHKYVNTTDEAESEWSIRTLQGRRKGEAQESKPRVFYLQAGQHAREVSLGFRPMSRNVAGTHLSNSLAVDLAVSFALLCAPLAYPSCDQPEPQHHQTARDFRIHHRPDYQPGWLSIRRLTLNFALREVTLSEQHCISNSLEITLGCGARIVKIWTTVIAKVSRTLVQERSQITDINPSQAST